MYGRDAINIDTPGGRIRAELYPCPDHPGMTIYIGGKKRGNQAVVIEWNETHKNFVIHTWDGSDDQENPVTAKFKRNKPLEGVPMK